MMVYESEGRNAKLHFQLDGCSCELLHASIRSGCAMNEHKVWLVASDIRRAAS